MNEKTGEEIHKEIREAVDCACRAFAQLGRAIQRIVSEIDWDAIAKACEECDEESDESGKEENRKTLLDYVRETGEYFGWNTETIQSQVNKVEAYGCFQTFNKDVFNHIWWRVNKGSLYGEAESDFEADVYTPTETYCEDYFGPVSHRKFGETEYTITELGRSLRSAQRTTAQPSGRPGPQGAGHRSDPEVREPLPTFLL